MLITDAAMSKRLPQVRRAPARRRDARTAYFEALVSEVHATAVSVAVITSAVNSFSDWKVFIDPSAVASFAPDTSALVALLRYLDEADPPLDFDAPFAAEFLQGLDAANSPLNAYLADCRSIGSPRAGTLHAGRLKPVWQPLCRLGAILVQAWHDKSPVVLPEIYEQNVQVLTALLAGASAGFRPCLNANGKLYVPPLPQKRRWPRRAVLENCKVLCAGTFRTAFVRDASAGGLGLDRVAGLKRGDIVTVELSTGRQFNGLVSWTSGSEAGVKFTKLLDASDPLISG